MEPTCPFTSSWGRGAFGWRLLILWRNTVNFSEYRRKDYVVPRSMKEAYGRDVQLYVEEESKVTKTDIFVSALIIAGGIACICIV